MAIANYLTIYYQLNRLSEQATKQAVKWSLPEILIAIFIVFWLCARNHFACQKYIILKRRSMIRQIVFLGIMMTFHVANTVVTSLQLEIAVKGVIRPGDMFQRNSYRKPNLIIFMVRGLLKKLYFMVLHLQMMWRNLFSMKNQSKQKKPLVLKFYSPFPALNLRCRKTLWLLWLSY